MTRREREERRFTAASVLISVATVIVALVLL